MSNSENVVGMPAPHWLDKIIGHEKDASRIAKAIGDSSQLKQIVETAVKFAAAMEADRKQKDAEGLHVLGGNYSTDVRNGIIEGVSSNNGHVPNPNEPTE